MSEVLLTEQLDQAVSILLRGAEATPASFDPEIAALLGVAADLRMLPRADFKARLRNELEGRTSMTTKTAAKTAGKAGKTREGFRAVTPYLTVPDVFAEIEFIKAAFGAEGQVYGLGSAGGYHSEYKVGDSMLMIGGGGGKAKWKGEPAPASLHVYVEDVDDVYRRALEAGAKSLMPPTDMDYGERSGAIEDPGGNHWYLATAFGPSYVPEERLDLMPHFSLRGTKKMIDFLESAFAAETLAVHESPDGVVHHAVVGILDSIVEMGEAHGPWQPRPMHFMLFVDDADAWYARAMQAEGAISMDEPADQPHGARVGTIKDPFDNVWYIATQL